MAVDLHGEVAPNHEEVVQGAKENEWCNRCSFITPPLFLRCWSGERRGGGGATGGTSNSTYVRSTETKLLKIDIAILHQSR